MKKYIICANNVFCGNLIYWDGNKWNYDGKYKLYNDFEKASSICTNLQERYAYLDYLANIEVVEYIDLTKK